MGGGVSPFEWIIPVVGATHAAYNAATDAVGANRANVVTPGSPDAKIAEEQKRLDDERSSLMAIQGGKDAETARINALQNPTADQIEENQRRARVSASQSLGLGRRRTATQTLTDVSSPLGV